MKTFSSFSFRVLCFVCGQPRYRDARIYRKCCSFNKYIILPQHMGSSSMGTIYININTEQSSLSTSKMSNSGEHIIIKYCVGTSGLTFIHNTNLPNAIKAINSTDWRHQWSGFIWHYVLCWTSSNTCWIHQSSYNVIVCVTGQVSSNTAKFGLHWQPPY